ncbi:MAG: cation transporter [Acidobacteriota bacterium]
MKAEIVSVDAASARRKLIRRGLILCLLTVVWNVIEGVVAVAAGLAAESIALFGFGIDSFVETASAAVVGLRLHHEWRGRSAEESEGAERLASRIAGVLLLLLAAYILVGAGRVLLGYGTEPAPSILGIVLTAVSLLLMPLLGWAKLDTARQIQSRALRADGYESISCAWLSFAVLVGLILNAAFGWWWMDPLAALALIPLIVREGLEGWRGESCECHD